MTIEKTLERIAVANERIAAALEAIAGKAEHKAVAQPAPQPAPAPAPKVEPAPAPQPAPAPKTEQAPAPQPEPEAEQAPAPAAVTFNDLTAASGKLLTVADGRTKLVNILKKNNVKRLTELPQAKWPEVLADINAAL